MSFELNILSVGQKEVTRFRENMSIIIKNEVEDEDEARYFEIWPLCVVQRVYGIHWV
jgi:hypothetical protein